MITRGYLHVNSENMLIKNDRNLQLDCPLGLYVKFRALKRPPKKRRKKYCVTDKSSKVKEKG